MADASSVEGKTSKEKAMQILNHTKVACVPGSEFYHSNEGENFVRFCFAKEDEILNQACNNLLKLKK
jgi:aminotransferase